MTTVVSDGPFRYSRNPMYVALMLIQIGVMLTSGMGWALILPVPTFLVLHYLIIVPEEHYLQATFGETYTDYQHRVRRWL